MEKISKEELMKKLSLTGDDLLNVVGGAHYNECEQRCAAGYSSCIQCCIGADATCADNCYAVYFNKCYAKC